MKNRSIVTSFVLLGLIATPAGAQTAPATQAASAITSIDLDEPTLVTLHVKDAPIDDVLRQLNEQVPAPAQVRLVRSAKKESFPPISLDFVREPYVRALARICAAAKAAPTQIGRDHGIDLMSLAVLNERRPDAEPEDSEISWVAGPCCVQGPFAIIARSITTSRTNSLQEAQRVTPATQHMTLQVALLVEPRVRVTAMSPWVQLSRAEIQGDRSVLADGAGANVSWVAHPSGSYFDFTAILPAVPSGAEKLTRLEGILHVRAVSKVQTIELADLSREQSVTVEDRACTVSKPVNQGNRGWQIVMKIPRDNSTGQAWEKIVERFRAGSRCYAFDGTGKPLTHYGTQSTGGTSDKDLTLTLHFGTDGGVGAPNRLVWEVPLETADLEIPVEFHLVPLLSCTETSSRLPVIGDGDPPTGLIPITSRESALQLKRGTRNSKISLFPNSSSVHQL